MSDLNSNINSNNNQEYWYTPNPVRNTLIVSLRDDKNLSWEAIGKHPSIVYLSNDRQLSRQRVLEIYNAVKAKQKGGDK